MSELVQIRPIETITAEIQFYKGQAGACILEIGKRLNEAKEQLAHGEWLPWLEGQVEFTERAAQRFMRLAREYSNPTLVSDLGATKALILLALPEDQREVFAEAVDATHCTAEELREAVNQARGWEMKCQAAKADADAAREAAEKREKELKLSEGVIAGLRVEVKELKSRPVEVSVKDASPEQIKAAKEAAWAEAEQAMEELRGELEQVRRKAAQAPMADQAVRAVAEINVLFGQIQTAAGRINELLPGLDEVTRARVAGVLKQALQKVG